MDWKPDSYKTCYEGFESKRNFPTNEALYQYRKMLLAKTEDQATFIASQVGTERLKVVEFGSGNGRLLIALSLKGILSYGLGIEVANSRVDFANQWCSDLRIVNVRNVVGDALTFTGWERRLYDLAICITGTFGFFRPVGEDVPGVLLERMRSALGLGSKLLLELYQLPDRQRETLALNDNCLRQWYRLPEEDAFAFYLDNMTYWPDRRVSLHKKIFIGRDGSIHEGASHVVAYYTIGELTSILAQHGFAMVSSWSDFKGGQYQEGVSSSLVALAEKR